jgi:hypothetical protein
MGQIEGSIGPYINAGTPVDGTDEIQTITPSAVPASGTFRLVFDGFKTTLLAWNVSANAMQTALNLLSSLGTGGVAVALNGGTGVYTITFSGANVAKRAQNLITVEDNTVLDASEDAVTLTVAEGTPGVEATCLGAAKGALLIDTTNGVLFINTGTAAAPVWQNFIPTDLLSAVELERLDGVTPGEVLASKAVVAGADKNVDVLAVADLKLGAGAGTSVTSTAAELNLLDTAEAGVAKAGIAVVAGADKNVDVLAVADLKLGAGAGTSVTSTAAELNLLDTAEAGVAKAGIALVAGADKNVDVLAVADLKLGAGAGTSVTSTAAELNKQHGAPLDASFVIGAEGGDAINVGIQLKDADGVDLAVRGMVKAYLSDDAAGDSLAAAAPSGGCAIGTDGVLVPLTPALTNALMVDGALAIDATPEKFKTTQTAAFLINGVSHVKAAAIEQVFSAAHVITASKFGVILVQINAAGTISTKVPASPQAYDDALTALAALPAVDAGNVALGYIAIENNAGDWTANTDDLTDASDVTTAAFTDASETAIGAAKAFELVSEADGDIDININEAGVATWYLILQLPNGKLVPSGAITFA